MKVVNDFFDYEILDMKDGQKLERWGNVILSRPDPQIICNSDADKSKWSNIDAKYDRSNTGGGMWHIYNKSIPTSWQISYKDMTFNLKLM